MLKIWLLPVLSVSFFGISAMACEMKQTESELFEHKYYTSDCDDPYTETDSLRADLPSFGASDKSADLDYWSHWNGHMVDNPMLSRGIEQNHFGLSFWQPNDEESQAEMTYAEWIRSHGLQFSLGIGEPGKPKFRFDYQWHEFQDDQVSFQVEFPF